MPRSKYFSLIMIAVLCVCLISTLPVNVLAEGNSTAEAPIQLLAAESGTGYSEMAAPSGVVGADRIWRVRFSQSVDMNSIKLQNIYVTMNGTTVPGITLESAGSGNQVIKVNPPASGYAPGNYELYITPGVLSGQTGNTLKQGVKMKFTVAAPLKIGAILPITSSEGDCGLQQQKGMELAVKYINAQGGINGQPLSIVFKDDAGDTAVATQAFQELASQGVPLVLGLPFNSAALAVAPLASQQKLPVILTTASDIHLGSYKDYVFKLSPSTHYEAQALNETLRDRGIKRVVVMYNDTDYGKDLMAEFTQDYAGSDRQVLATLSSPVGTIDYTSQLTTISGLAAASNDPLAIVFMGHATDLRHAWYEAYQMGISANWLGGDETVEDDIPQLGGTMAEGFLAVHPLAIIDHDPVSAAFKSEWAKYNDNSPDPDAAFAYDSVLLAAQALKSQGNNLDQALHNSVFNGVTGNKSFDADGFSNLLLYDLYEVENSKWQIIRRWHVH